MKKFNKAGPSVAGDHFTIDPLGRIDVESIESLIDDKRYFVLHAPRQTGKTTCLLALMDRLNAQGQYRAVYVNIEGAQAARGNVEMGIRGASSAFARSVAHYLKDTQPTEWLHTVGKETAIADLWTALLAQWAANDSRPAVLLLDEVDALVGDTLISLLRQIRAGYAQRPTAFPQTVVLCGVRDVRDYRMETADKEIITGGSAFNIKAVSLRLGNFTTEESIALWQQHTEECGQVFDAAIWPELWEDTRGQPWLVNALAYECTWTDKSARDRSTPISLERYKQAKERLIYSRQTHLDALSDKLREARVNTIIAAMLSGDENAESFPTDDLQYIEDLGLITTRPTLRIANRIYREVLPREITYPIQTTLTLKHEQPWYVTPERRLDMAKLLTSFQQFFREHSDAWIEGFTFKEAGPQLLMQAFLQRIFNGGGRINREYGLGLKRTDLFIEWPMDEQLGFYGPMQRVVIELKLWKKGSLEMIINDAIAQTVDYADRCGADEAHIVIFDRRADVPWEDRIWHKDAEQGSWHLGVWGA